MQKNSFYSTFLDLLRELFDAENQIVQGLPKMASSASHPELKEAFNQHLEETKNQIQRLKKIFKTLNENPTGVKSEVMECLLAQCQKAMNSDNSPAVKDATLIIAAQKVEHNEISSYGSVRALARHLSDSGVNDHIDFDEIADTLQQSLDEEGEADEKLTEIAEGGFFSKGINDEAQRELQQQTKADRNK